jgi:hypothetical protein
MDGKEDRWIILYGWTTDDESWMDGWMVGWMHELELTPLTFLFAM